VFRPNVVRVVRIGPVAVDSATRLATLAYVFMVFLLFAAGGIALLLLERENGIDVVTALTASATTLNNVGPGLGLVSATSNFAWFSQAGKVVLSLLMVLGRLERRLVCATLLDAGMSRRTGAAAVRRGCLRVPGPPQ